MPYNGTRRKVFISHYKGDKTEVDDFIDYFGNQERVFNPFVLGANDNDDFIESTNTDKVLCYGANQEEIPARHNSHYSHDR